MLARRRRPSRLSHVDPDGQARMVDVSPKPETAREAVAAGEVRISAAARRAIRDRRVAKGDPLQTARLAGILAAKKTSDLIPLCHPVALDHVQVELEATAWGYRVLATTRATGRTGVEMEALVAVAGTALTLYDMLKAIDRGITIGPIRLIGKRGGQSGEYWRPGRRR